jgi:NADPH:quinone reductase-like Zn-dependent oxidoreductase
LNFQEIRTYWVLSRHCKGLSTGKPEHNAFQLYTVGFENLTALIPSSLSFERAVVLPLAISTASCGLYLKDFLHLPYPTKNPKPTGKTILIYGASSSVGSAAVQLAVASGVTVVATASKRNAPFVVSLGATAVLDYSEESLVADLVVELRKYGEFAGIYDCIASPDTLRNSISVAEKLGGGFIAATLTPPKDLPKGVTAEWSKSCTNRSLLVCANISDQLLRFTSSTEILRLLTRFGRTSLPKLWLTVGCRQSLIQL